LTNTHAANHLGIVLTVAFLVGSLLGLAMLVSLPGCGGPFDPNTIDPNVTPTPTPPPEGYKLTVATTGVGSVTRTPDSDGYQVNEQVRLLATPGEGWMFVGWSGAVYGSNNPENLVMNANKEVTAIFQELPPAERTLTVNVEGQGMVVRDPAGTSYPLNTEVTLTAVAAQNWTFSHWEGDPVDGNTNAEVTVLIDENKSVTAVFRAKPRLLVTVLGEGTVDPTGGYYNLNAQVTLTATPASGWRFDHWEDDATGTSATTALTMDDDKSVTAVFVRQYTLTVEVTGEGTVDPSSGPYDEDDEVTLTATAASGWVFDHWEGDLSGTTNPATIVIDTGKTVRAVFKELFSLTVMYVGQGTVDPNGGTYADGTELSLSAAGAVGWRFDHWEDDLSGTDNPETLTIDADKLVTAVFVEQMTLTITVVGQGSVETNPSGTQFDEGAEVELTAVPDEGWQFSHWEGDLTGITNPETLYMDADREVTAVFTERPQLTVIIEGQGTVAPPSGFYDWDETLEMTATPASGWVFDHWEGDLTGTDNPQDLVMDEDKTVTAVFLGTYTLTTSVVGDGDVDLDPTGGTYASGTTVTVTAVPAYGRQFSHWESDDDEDIDGSETNPETVTMTEDKAITAVFIEPPSLRMSMEGQGTVTIVNVTTPDDPNSPYVLDNPDDELEIEFPLNTVLQITPTGGGGLWVFDHWYDWYRQNRIPTPTADWPAGETVPGHEEADPEGSYYLTIDGRKDLTAHFIQITGDAITSVTNSVESTTDALIFRDSLMVKVGISEFYGGLPYYEYYYTTNGYEPDQGDTFYLEPPEPIEITKTTTVRSRVYDPVNQRRDGHSVQFVKIGDGGGLPDDGYGDPNDPNTLVVAPVHIPPADAGWYHTIEVREDRTVWACGDNQWGQIGQGHLEGIPLFGSNHSSQMFPEMTQVKGEGGVGFLTGVLAAAAGGFHNVAVDADGNVWCWGLNDYGQCGDGTFTTRPSPVQVIREDTGQPLTNVVIVGAGAWHSFAVDTAGRVWSWGRNDRGQLGDGGTVQHYGAVWVRDPGGLTNLGSLGVVTYITGGWYHSMAIIEGALYTWGGNSKGQLGLGFTSPEFLPGSKLPRLVNTGGQAVVSVDGGNTHTVAALADGTVWACGNNEQGQLGVFGPEHEPPGIALSSIPVPVTQHYKYDPNDPDALVDPQTGDFASRFIVQVAAGSFHSLALESVGSGAAEEYQLWSWGAGSKGQLGFVHTYTGPSEFDALIAVAPNVSTFYLPDEAASRSLRVYELGSHHLAYTAEIVWPGGTAEEDKWVQITSGAEGSTPGIITLGFAANDQPNDPENPGEIIARSDATLSISAADAANSPQEIALLQAAPTDDPRVYAEWQIESYESKLSKLVTQEIVGAPVTTSRNLYIWNNGGEDLNWTASSASPWISIGTASGTNGATVVVQAAATDLLSDSRTATITLGGNGGSQILGLRQGRWLSPASLSGGGGSRDLPVAVTPFGVYDPESDNALAGVLSIAAGYEHSLAVHVSRRLLVWGNGNYGQLGNWSRDIKSLRDWAYWATDAEHEANEWNFNGNRWSDLDFFLW